MPSRVVTQGNYAAAVDALVAGVGIDRAPNVPRGTLLQSLLDDVRLSAGERSLVWFAYQIYNGGIQQNLANLDQGNRRLLVEVLAGFAGVDL